MHGHDRELRHKKYRRVDKNIIYTACNFKIHHGYVFPLKIYFPNPFCWCENEFALPELRVGCGRTGVQRRDVLEMQWKHHPWLRLPPWCLLSLPATEIFLFHQPLCCTHLLELWYCLSHSDHASLACPQSWDFLMFPKWPHTLLPIWFWGQDLENTTIFEYQSIRKLLMMVCQFQYFHIFKVLLPWKSALAYTLVEVE